LLDHVGVPLELIADRRPDEIRAVRIESVLHHQIHVVRDDLNGPYGFCRTGGQIVGRSDLSEMSGASAKSLDAAGRGMLEHTKNIHMSGCNATALHLN